MTLLRPVDIAQTTPTGSAVAIAIAEGYGFGEILDCVLLRRGFNHVYALRFADGAVLSHGCAPVGHAAHPTPNSRLHSLLITNPPERQ